MINNVVLVGRLGRDPEVKKAASGTTICKFSLAVQRPPRRGEDDGEKAEQITDWINVVTFGRTAESVEQYLGKGSLVGIEGRIQSSTWEKEDGTKGYAVEINAQRVDFLESRSERERRMENSDDDDYEQREDVTEDAGEEEDEDPFADD